MILVGGVPPTQGALPLGVFSPNQMRNKMTKLLKMTFDEIAALKAGDRVSIKCKLSGRISDYAYKLEADAEWAPANPRYTKEGLMAMGFPEEVAEKNWERMYHPTITLRPLGFEKQVHAVEEGFSKWVFKKA